MASIGNQTWTSFWMIVSQVQMSSRNTATRKSGQMVSLFPDWNYNICNTVLLEIIVRPVQRVRQTNWGKKFGSKEKFQLAVVQIWREELEINNLRKVADYHCGSTAPRACADWEPNRSTIGRLQADDFNCFLRQTRIYTVLNFKWYLNI